MPLDSTWVRSQLTADVATAERLESVGRWDDAQQLFREIAQDYGAWPAARDANARAESIAQRPAFRRYQDERRKVAEQDERQATELQRALVWARQQRSPPSAAALEDKLQIRALQQRVARGDSVEAASARRLLARVFVFVSFYEPRTYLAAHDAQHALQMLKVAVDIAPLGGESCPLLRDALSAAGAEQQRAFAGQCDAKPSSGGVQLAFRNWASTGRTGCVMTFLTRTGKHRCRGQIRPDNPLRERDFTSIRYRR
jgi:hypothetical protein